MARLDSTEMPGKFAGARLLDLFAARARADAECASAASTAACSAGRCAASLGRCQRCHHLSSLASRASNAASCWRAATMSDSAWRSCCSAVLALLELPAIAFERPRLALALFLLGGKILHQQRR